MKNNFWAVYKKGHIVSLSRDKTKAKVEALRLSNHRWTNQNFKEDWGFLVKEGYEALRVKIEPKD
jgi:hypothetical protein